MRRQFPRGDTLDFHLSITENNPVHIRLINIEGNTKTHEKVIRRELVVKPGTIFKSDVLGRSLRDLMILNFFANVEPGWDILPNGDIDLKIKITEKETGQFSVGAGYSQTDKFVATIGLGIPNLFGTGQTAIAQCGTRRQPQYLRSQLSRALASRYADIARSSGTAHLSMPRIATGTAGSPSAAPAAIFRSAADLRWPDNYFRIYAGYRLEQVDYRDISQRTISRDNNDNPYSIDKQDWPLTTSSFSSIHNSRFARPVAVRHQGFDVSWRNELAGTVLGGNWNYFKQDYTAEYYKTIFWKVVFMGADQIRHDGRYQSPRCRYPLQRTIRARRCRSRRHNPRLR